MSRLRWESCSTLAKRVATWGLPSAAVADQSIHRRNTTKLKTASGLRSTYDRRTGCYIIGWEQSWRMADDRQRLWNTIMALCNCIQVTSERCKSCSGPA